MGITSVKVTFLRSFFKQIFKNIKKFEFKHIYVIKTRDASMPHPKACKISRI